MKTIDEDCTSKYQADIQLLKARIRLIIMVINELNEIKKDDIKNELQDLIIFINQNLIKH